MTGDGDRGTASGPADATGPAVAAALGGAAADAASAYLREQTTLTRMQIDDMRREDRLRLWSFRVRHVSDVLRLAFQFGIAFIILTVAGLIGLSVWDAAHDNSLVIEAFRVPPDLAAKGLTGEVIAARVQDRLATLQAQTNSMRAASSYQNNWGDEIKVQIPETGISIGELSRYLREWLGSQTRISGEIYHNGSGLTVTARAGGGVGQSFSGTENDIGALLQQAAEAVYATTQPYRYAVYLTNRNRPAEAKVIFAKLIAHGSADERAWAYAGLSTLDVSQNDTKAQLRDLDAALAIRPDFILAYINRDGIYSNLQHFEQSYRAEQRLDRLLKGRPEADITPAAWAVQRHVNDANLAAAKGDYKSSLAAVRQVEALPDYSGSAEGARIFDITLEAYLHDRDAMMRAIAALPPVSSPNADLNRAVNIFVAYALIGDWHAVLAEGPGIIAKFEKAGPATQTVIARTLRPLTAYAMAMTGDVAGAKALIAAAPADCDNCLRVRVRIATKAGNWHAAEHFAARLAARAPPLPFGDYDWGFALLAKGDAEGAIAKFRSAHDKGPHYADPLEGWGEALLLANRADLALARFAQAAEYAPHWGRLHLKWGEALLYTGKKDEARKQLTMAGRLDLSAGEKAELVAFRKASG